MLERIQKNFPFIFILPSVNVVLLQVWAPSMHNLVDGLFILWDFVVYLGLGALTIALSANVIFSQSPIRSLFSLIGVFICAILLFLSIRVEFLSMIFLIVYIGAIAILFLFVIMLLNLKKAMPSGSRAFWANWANPVFFLFLSERGYVFLSSAVYVNSYYNSRSLAGHANAGLSELNQINYYMRYGLSDASIFSDLFYGVHGFLFLATACVLAVSMIGSIILALSTSEPKV